MDVQALQALLLSIIAGTATLIGALIVIVIKGENKKFISASLGFAAGIMISVSMLELFSKSNELITSSTNSFMGAIISTLCLGIGMLLTFLLNHFIQDESVAVDTLSNNRLLSTGIISMLVIALHNFPEGIATFMSSYGNASLGISITIAVALHNIPEGITVALPILLSTNNKKKAIFFTFLSGITEPLGAILAFFILRFFLTDLVLGAIFGIVGGIMIYIALDDLIPSSRKYGCDGIALFFTLLGICIIPLTNIIK